MFKAHWRIGEIGRKSFFTFFGVRRKRPLRHARARSRCSLFAYVVPPLGRCGAEASKVLPDDRDSADWFHEKQVQL